MQLLKMYRVYIFFLEEIKYESTAKVLHKMQPSKFLQHN